MHHSGKAGTTMDLHGGRGASSIPAAGRVNETLSAATKEDRDRYGFAEGVACLETTKSNMAAIRDGNTQWLRLLSHEVGNGEYAQVSELLDPKNNAERMDDVLFAALRDAVLTPPPDGGGAWLTKEGAGNWIGRALRDGGVGTDAREGDGARMGQARPARPRSRRARQPGPPAQERRQTQREQGGEVCAEPVGRLTRRKPAEIWQTSRFPEEAELRSDTLRVGGCLGVRRHRHRHGKEQGSEVTG